MLLAKRNLNPTNGGRYFWFSYQAPERALRDQPYIHLVRDGAAFAELAPVLGSMGYGYGGLLLNFPPRPSLGNPARRHPANDTGRSARPGDEATH